MSLFSTQGTDNTSRNIILWLYESRFLNLTISSCRSLHVPVDPIQIGINPGVDPGEVAPGALHAEGGDPDDGPPAIFHEEHGPARVPGAGVLALVTGADLLRGADGGHPGDGGVGAGAGGARDQLDVCLKSGNNANKVYARMATMGWHNC